MNYHIDFDLDFKRNPYSGKLIVLEGLDTSGKSTQAKKLLEALRARGKTVFLTKNPTRVGEIGELIHRILQKEVKVPPAAIQYLYSADREVQQEEIIKHLKNGEIVITDRYFWSGVPYGLADLKDFPLEEEAKIILVAQSMLSHYHSFVLPDYTFYLQISIETAIERLSKMHKVREIYEEEGVFKRVKMGYEWLLKEFKDEIIVINGENTEEEVLEEIISKIKL
jgi:dTMP kinase